MSSDDCLLIARAAALAAERHVGDTWKHAGGNQPAILHLAEVALLVARAPCDATVVAAAWLHDSVEDNVATLSEIEASFGKRVAAIVAAVSDDMTLNKTERWQRQIDETPHKDADIRAIKIADKISNLRAIAALGQPAIDDARAYLPFAAAVAASCRNISPHLDKAFDDAVTRVRALLATSDAAL